MARCSFMLYSERMGVLVRCVADAVELTADKIRVCAEHAAEIRGDHARSGTAADRCAYSTDGCPTDIEYIRPMAAPEWIQ